jgi:hypothetical protein
MPLGEAAQGWTGVEKPWRAAIERGEERHGGHWTYVYFCQLSLPDSMWCNLTIVLQHRGWQY